MERGRVIWLGAVVALLLAGIAVRAAGAVDDVYYQLRAVPAWLHPLAWAVASVLVLFAVAPGSPRHRARWYVFGALVMVLSLLLWIHTALESIDGERHRELARVQIQGYVLVQEQRWEGGASVPDCGLYLRQDGWLLSREVPLTSATDCPRPRVAEGGAGFELVTREGEVVGEVDPADHF